MLLSNPTGRRLMEKRSGDCGGMLRNLSFYCSEQGSVDQNTGENEGDSAKKHHLQKYNDDPLKGFDHFQWEIPKPFYSLDCLLGKMDKRCLP